MASSHQGKTVFVCHAGENKPFVRQLVDRLEKDGLAKDRIFYDEISLQPGDELDSIIKVIESPSLKLFVFVVSKYCFQSNKIWIRVEWEAAFKNNKEIFPIWLDDNNDDFKAFGNLVKEFSYNLKKIIAERVNLQEISTSLPGLSGKICSLVYGSDRSSSRPSIRQNIFPGAVRSADVLDDYTMVRRQLCMAENELRRGVGGARRELSSNSEDVLLLDTSRSAVPDLAPKSPWVPWGGARSKMRMHEASGVRLCCKGCPDDEFICYASELRLLDGDHHIYPYRQWDKVEFRQHTDKKKQDWGIQKVYCKKCGFDFGNTYKGYPCLKIASFNIFLPGRATAVTRKQWKDVPFELESMTV